MKFVGVKAPQAILSTDMVTTDMTISADKMNIAAYYLRDAIYNNKPLAVIREYICNAIDEHDKYSIEKPVDVWISCDNNDYYLNIRDYAKGLPDEGIRFTFGALLESTKNTTNDSMGGFGIGSKAGHAYAQFFEVSSYYEGTVSYYNFALEKDDKYPVPIGKTRLLASEPTTETGLLVRVPILYRDLNTFKSLIKEFILNCKYVENNPSVQYTEGTIVIIPTPEITEVLENGVTISIKEKDKSLNVGKYNRRHNIRMGSATYPAPEWVVELLNGHTNVQLHALVSTKINLFCSIIIDVPVGSVSVPLSRESIESTDSNKKFLTNAIKQLHDRSEKRKAEISVDYDKIVSDRDLFGDTRKGLFIFSLSDIGISSINSVPRPIPHNKTDRRYIIIIPNNNYKGRWISMLDSFALEDQTSQYCYSVTNNEPDFKTIVKGDYKILKIKELRPELKRRKILKSGFGATKKLGDDRRFKVVFGYRDSSDFSPKEMIETKKPDKGFKKLEDIESLDELKTHLITSSKGYHDSYRIPLINSSIMFSKLIEGGFINYANSEVKAKYRLLESRANITSELRSQIREYGLGIYSPSVAISNMFERVNKDLESKTTDQKIRLTKRLTQIKSKVKDKNMKTLSATGKKVIMVYTSCPSYYLSGSKLSRAELRTIIKL